MKPFDRTEFMVHFYENIEIYFIDCLKRNSGNTKPWYCFAYAFEWSLVAENSANVSALWVNTCYLRWNVNRLMSLFKFGNILWCAEGCWLNSWLTLFCLKCSYKGRMWKCWSYVYSYAYVFLLKIKLHYVVVLKYLRQMMKCSTLFCHLSIRQGSTQFEFVRIPNQNSWYLSVLTFTARTNYKNNKTYYKIWHPRDLI